MHNPAVPAGRADLDPARGVAAGLACVLVAALCYGLGPTLGRLAYDAGSDPATVLAFRSAFAFLIIWTILGARGARPMTRGPLPRRALALGGLLMTASVGYYGAVKLIPVGLAALIFFTFPLIVAVVQALGGRERLSPLRLALLLAAFGGLALMLGVSVGALDGRGIALALLASASVAAILVLTPRLLPGVDSLTINGHMLAVSAGVFVLAMMFSGGPALPSGAAGWVGLVGGTIIYAAGVIGFFAAISRVGPTRTAMFMNIEPVVSIACAFIVLGERLSAHQVAGGVLVLGAVASMPWLDRRRAASGG
jgi:drug/metabolite transporter (DMT)-like permease